MFFRVTCGIWLTAAVMFAQADTNTRLEKGREFLGLAAPADPAAAARGQVMFLQNCSFCHGANAKGAEGPDLVRSTLVLHDVNGDSIATVVKNGRPDRGMPPFPSFTPEQIRDIAAFLHSRVEAAANRFGYKLLNVVTGNAEAGGVFFAQHCSSCHSGTGDLAKVASKFEPSDLQAQFLSPSSKAPVTATVIDASGVRTEGRLKSIDDFEISLVTPDGTVRSFDRSKVKCEVHDPLTGHRELLPLYTNSDMHNVLAYLETLK